MKRIGGGSAGGVLFSIIVAALVCRFPAAGHAQDEAPAAKAAPDEAPVAKTAQDQAAVAKAKKLAEEFSDPLTTLPQLFMQDAYTPENYGTKAGTNRVILRAIVPRIPKYALLPFVQLIRPSVQLVTVPTGKGSGTRTEFGDMPVFDLAVPSWPDWKEHGLLMGVGPVFVFPTATYKTAGQRAWQVGPAFGTIYKGIPRLLIGCLIQNPISFAYTSPEAKRQNTLIFQPILLTYLGWGFYAKSADASWNMSWQHNTPTLLPLSFGIGKVLLREGLPPLNFFVTGEWMAYRQFAPIAPQTTVRFGMTIAFPDLAPWR